MSVDDCWLNETSDASIDLEEELLMCFKSAVHTLELPETFHQTISEQLAANSINPARNHPGVPTYGVEPSCLPSSFHIPRRHSHFLPAAEFSSYSTLPVIPESPDE
mmetsp:Transcript_267/g.362  ORF Transcript_267/g.362 Transcript_267/m.362 type:complete len:106 (-) Transcript_267:98-415(-)|eukprot:CAMPEP_0168565530 /NCGR_PEP_ID=MMETSP0413-20121227/13895_1 /TAXON_ID=136452 /ORGANISM="Filamoeba nolandi, Strain NC-AS-23-1" /LENGTH=105 /DNA_ID=CAMNT_0008597409 /DNA_START=94 /DNA_END=411 /DNA_ORIENTATION=+